MSDLFPDDPWVLLEFKLEIKADTLHSDVMFHVQPAMTINTFAFDFISIAVVRARSSALSRFEVRLVGPIVTQSRGFSILKVNPRSLIRMTVQWHMQQKGRGPRAMLVMHSSSAASH